MRKIIFLDIDGVLNCENGFKKDYCKYDNENSEMGMDFYPPSKDLLNKLIRETDAKIVISSTWRLDGLERMQELWKYRGMSGEIIDITPNIHSIKYGEENITLPRGVEIKHWLNKNGFTHINWSKEKQYEYMVKSNILNYIIIDDDSDMLYQQKNHFVHVLPSPRNKNGFNKKYYNKAKSILEKSIIDVNYL